jgi:large subunit ribosomal protein L6
MSRIGRLPVTVPAGAAAEFKDGVITVKGPLGTLTQSIDKKINVKVEAGVIHVERSCDDKEDRALHGLYRALINNMVTGVTKGFTKVLQVNGVGYKLAVNGGKLTMNIGYSHPVEYEAPEGIKITVNGNTEITVAGIDKHAVGQVAATIKDFKKVEPYHGYGIRYKNEVVLMKEGKKSGKK